MPIENNKDYKEDTVDTQNYVDRRIIHERELTDARDKFIDEKLSSIEEARRLAKIEQDRRLDTMNEFRGQLKDQAATFITKDAVEAKLTSVELEIDTLSKDSNKYMTVERFDQSHKALIEKIESKFEVYDSKLLNEEKVTIRQDATQQLLDKLAVNSRWLIGLSIATAISLAGLLVAVIKIFAGV